MNAVSHRVPETPLPLFARVLLISPQTIEARLDAIAKAATLPLVPNRWQITLGILRMWHRLIFRSDTVGCSSRSIRPGLRARLLSLRPLRFPFLLRERAVHPLDFSGLLSSRERVIRHLLGAHHDGIQFLYDLEMLSLDPAALSDLEARAEAVVQERDPRAKYLADLTVFEGYHRDLLAAVDAFSRGSLSTGEAAFDPDISFFGYLGWCARQPTSFTDTLNRLRSGRYDFAQGMTP